VRAGFVYEEKRQRCRNCHDDWLRSRMVRPRTMPFAIRPAGYRGVEWRGSGDGGSEIAIGH
jgi:hypothetical protein